MSLVKMLAAAALLAGASPAAAQFTAAIPPRQPAGSAAAGAADSVARDTAVAVRLRDMREWVDSAAVALDVNVPPSSDSAALDTAAAAPAPQASAPGGETQFRDGAPAPDTATALPFIALIGAGSLLVGAWMLRR